MNEKRGVESIANFILEEFMNIFTMYLNNVPKVFDTSFLGGYSAPPPFRTVSAEVIERTIITSKDP